MLYLNLGPGPPPSLPRASDCSIKKSPEKTGARGQVHFRILKENERFIPGLRGKEFR